MMNSLVIRAVAVVCLIGTLVGAFCPLPVPFVARHTGSAQILASPLSLEAKKRKKAKKSSTAETTKELVELAVTDVKNGAAEDSAKKAEATARNLLAFRLEMESRLPAKVAEATKELVELAVTNVKTGAAEASAKKAEATARNLLATRLEMESRHPAKVAEIPVEEPEPVIVEESPEPVAEIPVEEPEAVAVEESPEPVAEIPVEEPESVIVEESPEPIAEIPVEEPEPVAVEESPEPVAEIPVEEPEPIAVEESPEPVVVDNEPEAKVSSPSFVEKTSDPVGLSIVPVNRESVEFTAGGLGFAVGWAVGGPLLGIVGGTVANFVSKAVEGRTAKLVQSISKTSLDIYNSIAGFDVKYQVLEKTQKSLKGALDNLRELDNVDPVAIDNLEKALASTTERMAAFNKQYDPVNAGAEVLNAYGNAVEKTGRKVSDFNDSYKITERASATVKDAFERTQSALDEQLDNLK